MNTDIKGSIYKGTQSIHEGKTQEYDELTIQQAVWAETETQLSFKVALKKDESTEVCDS